MQCDMAHFKCDSKRCRILGRATVYVREMAGARKQKFALAVSETVGEFNTGAASNALVLTTSGAKPEHNMLSHGLLEYTDVKLQNHAEKCEG